MDDRKGHNDYVYSRGDRYWDSSVHWLYGFYWNNGTDITAAITNVHGVWYDCQSSDYGKYISDFKGKKSDRL